MSSSSSSSSSSTPSRRLEAYTDGGARPNPGHAAYGVVLRVDGSECTAYGVYLGASTTNNEAEYAGVVDALRRMRERCRVAAYDCTLYTDSQLIERQLSGRYQCRDAKLVPLYDEALELVGETRCRVVHVVRARNRLADAVCSRSIKLRSACTVRVLETICNAPSDGGSKRRRQEPEQAVDRVSDTKRRTESTATQNDAAL